jgi:hypothetical protein
MTSDVDLSEQNSDLNNQNRTRDDGKNPSSSSSSSSSRPPPSNYRQLLMFKEAAGLKEPAEFVCPGMAKEKDRAARLEAIAKDSIEKMKKASKSYTEL